MVTYERETRVRAPLDAVWKFHSSTDGLEAVTPDFMNLEVDEVVGPNGERNPDVLEAGSRVHASIRPFGVGPSQTWTSVIVERRRDDSSATFRDVMEDGLFPRWEHTHSFFEDGDGTRIVDRVVYELPGGAIGRAASPLAWVGLEPLFRKRHSRARERLESDLNVGGL